VTQSETDPNLVPQILVGISFDDGYRADEFLSSARRLASRGRLVLLDAVIVRMNEGGRILVHETTDLEPVRTAWSGAVWAGLFGLLVGGPVGWVAGTAVGAGGGALAAKVIDHGISDEWVGWFREAVRPGKVIVALLVEDLDQDALVTEAARFVGAELVYSNLDALTIERVRSALGG